MCAKRSRDGHARRSGQGAAFALALALAAGCSPRADIVPDAAAAQAEQSVRVYVGTTRERAPNRLWSPFRPGALNYGYVDVSVPAKRTPGVVTLPRGEPDPQTDYLTRQVAVYADRGAFRAAARRAFLDAGGDGETVVTVHGFNNTMGDGIFRTAQMIEDFGMRGPTFHFAWPSRGATLGYAADRDAALLARDGLEGMLDDLRIAGAREIVLVAHSMGAQLTMEVVRQMALRGNRQTLARLGGVVLMSPDIDPALFRAQAEDIGRLPQPFVIFVSRRDPALRLSARLTGHADRLGNIASIEEVAGLDVTVIDLSGARDAASRHLAAATSPTVIGFLRGTEAVRRGIERDASGQVGLLPGAVLVAQEATAVMLAPVEAMVGGLEPE